MAPKRVAAPPKNWQDWAILIMGVWLLVSPWGLHYLNANSLASGADFVIGAVLIIVSLVSRAAFHISEELIDLALALGIALTISPWVLGYDAATMAADNALIVGGIVIYFAVWELQDIRCCCSAHST
ncbi:MAG: SPW repeat protein [Alphaproteobacteria bacterium]|nr:SPW repeat protein [Alphaproteobacteria bacterium]